MALACGRGDRAQGRRLRYLAPCNWALAAVQAVEAEGARDAAGHAQFRRRPDPRCARVDAAGRSDRLSGLAAAADASMDQARHVPEDRGRLAQLLPAGISPVECRRSPAAERLSGDCVERRAEAQGEARGLGHWLLPASAARGEGGPLSGAEWWRGLAPSVPNPSTIESSFDGPPPHRSRDGEGLHAAIAS